MSSGPISHDPATGMPYSHLADDDDPMTPADHERQAEAEAADAHYSDLPDVATWATLTPEELRGGIDPLEPADEGRRCALCSCPATCRLVGFLVCGYHETNGEADPACPTCYPLADCPHPVDGFVTVTVEGGSTPRRACGACWKDFGPVTDELPAPTTEPLDVGSLMTMLEQVGSVFREHAPAIVAALTDELRSVRWQLEQEGLRKRQTERQLEIERREHAAAREAWGRQRKLLTDELEQREADVLELLGQIDQAAGPAVAEVLAEFRTRKADAIDAGRYAQPGEVQQRSRTMPFAGGDPDDHVLSGS